MPTAGTAPFARSSRPSRSCAPPAALRREDRRPGRRQGRARHHRPRRGRGRRAGQALRGQAFGDAGRTVVIEEGLIGPEVSVFAVCDGTRAVALAPAQDFKRVGDGDTGPNTGGMGAYCPLPWLEAGLRRRRRGPLRRSRRSTSSGARGIDYRGVLYTGLMLTAGRTEARRVQRPLRRPRQPGRPAAPHRPTSPLCSPLPRRARSPSSPPTTTTPPCWSSRPPRATRPRRAPATHRGPRRRPSRRRGHACSAPGSARCRGSPRHRRRPGARRHRTGSGPGDRPVRRLRGARPPPLAGRFHHRTDIAQRGQCMNHKVAVLMGSPNDRDKMQPAVDTLERFGIERRRAGAVRPPQPGQGRRSWPRRPVPTGYVAFICGAGMAAHLAGVVAAHTTLPVVGRAAVGRGPQRGRRALLHGADAQGHPGGHRRHRRRR